MNTAWSEARLRQLYPDLPPFQHQPGWLCLLAKCLTQMTQVGCDLQQHRIVQIKQKLGSLRIHIDTRGMTPTLRAEISSVLAQTLAASRCVCELCGHTARQRMGDQGLQTLCAAHARDKLPPVIDRAG